MSDAHKIEGQCLCGAVTVTAMVTDPKLRACHCDMCNRHTGGPFFSVNADPATVQVSGTPATYRSSDWAERGFCATCGSTLWYATVHDGARHLSAGLFDNAAGGTLAIEFFADACPQGYALAGSHKKLTTPETIALFAPDEG
ncbi:GFA family protein [Sulfitobacter sp. S190]|uniref:GFA family protein n=1 Tax=Sulfitobacter sp. S190 TaxID=2867022 RepID=UPI0021A857FC|nr:GFA family protein [Sulfitobacter sp. S190]UWR22544.1 GFA family protein [Sulfitobacter sp. S190]